MKRLSAVEYPPAQEQALQKARRLQYWTLAFLISTAILLYLVMGSSQAMKTAWAEDMLSLIPPIVFLISSRFAALPPNERFPCGYHRMVSVGYLIASLALTVVGVWLLYEGIAALIKLEHPSIGAIDLFGHTVWLGWLMMPVLLWSAIPPVFLGRAKLALARNLQDKVLYADAKINKADWLTAVAALVGVGGIALGIWWADAVAAALISFDILKDGYTNLRESILDLMDESPRQVGESRRDPLPGRLAEEMQKLDWVAAARARLRDEGHVYFGEILVVPRDARDLLTKLTKANEQLRSIDWRVYDVKVVPVQSLDE